MEIRDRVYNVATKVLDLDRSILNEELSIGDVRTWDSLGQVSLISALEKEFGCEFDIDETLEMESIGDILEIIKERS